MLVICCLLRRLTAVQESGLYEVFAENNQRQTSSDSKCKLKCKDASVFIVTEVFFHSCHSNKKLSCRREFARLLVLTEKMFLSINITDKRYCRKISYRKVSARLNNFLANFISKFLCMCC